MIENLQRKGCCNYLECGDVFSHLIWLAIWWTSFGSFNWTIWDAFLTHSYMRSMVILKNLNWSTEKIRYQPIHRYTFLALLGMTRWTRVFYGLKGKYYCFFTVYCFHKPFFVNLQITYNQYLIYFCFSILSSIHSAHLARFFILLFYCKSYQLIFFHLLTKSWLNSIQSSIHFFYKFIYYFISFIHSFFCLFLFFSILLFSFLFSIHSLLHFTFNHRTERVSTAKTVKQRLIIDLVHWIQKWVKIRHSYINNETRGPMERFKHFFFM